MKTDNYYKRKKFISCIVKYLHMDLTDFKKCVDNDMCYEKTIYDWAIKLYKKGIHCEQAIQIIFRARIFLMIRNRFHLTT